jgi:hypothetical protein
VSGDHNKYQKGSVAQQQPESEPVAWIKKDRSSIEVSIMSAEYMRNEGFEPLYTAPPQREWQGLTYKERNDCLVEADPCEALLDHEAHELMRTVEAKLKEKNG